MESRRQAMLFLPLCGGPGDAVEVGVRIVRLDERPEPPDGGGVCDVCLSKPPFEVPEWRRPTMRPSPSTMREPESPWLRPLVVIVDGQLDGLLLGVVVANKRVHDCGASDGELSSVTVFDDDEAGLVVVIEQVGVGQELL